MLLTSRRAFLAAIAAKGQVRRYHVCLAPDALEAEAGLLEVVRDAGVSDVWVAGYFYGHWHYTPERIGVQLRRIEKLGLRGHVVQLPLGHPGDSLGAVTGQPPLIPPAHWSRVVRADGRIQWGTSLHEPATAENAEALRRLGAMGVRAVFLDDDFRLASGPGSIGGCYCPRHIEDFRRAHGYGASCGAELRAAVGARTLNGMVRAWVDFHCDRLSESFVAMQRTEPRISLGVMVMYLGSEKAGIRLADYQKAPFRVGELMFRDKDFEPVKGKTDELFSALFHRRFARPELAYSETTAFPANALSAPNLAAKLAISTLADVRNTMFMSGLTPFPRAHWSVLAPAMRAQAALHAEFAGLRPAGPFRHYWGEASRYVGDDRPYSLFLAAGVPFSVCDAAPETGWAFLSDADAGAAWRAGARAVSRRTRPETLRDLFALKREIRGELETAGTPYVVEDQPAVLAWYPEARVALVWNLAEQAVRLTVRMRGRDVAVTAGPLELVKVPGL